MLVVAMSVGYEQYESLFLQLCDERRTVNAFELQELLETCLPNGELATSKLSSCELNVFLQILFF
jgi:hypothetical protein